MEWKKHPPGDDVEENKGITADKCRNIRLEKSRDRVALIEKEGWCRMSAIWSNLPLWAKGVVGLVIILASIGIGNGIIPPSESTFVYQGWVLDSEEEPIHLADVSVAFSEKIRIADTDEDGMFRIEIPVEFEDEIGSISIEKDGYEGIDKKNIDLVRGGNKSFTLTDSPNNGTGSPPSPKPPSPDPSNPTVVGRNTPTPTPPPLFPVTLKDWEQELKKRNEDFGECVGYWCYVTLNTYPYWIAKYPITIKQYKEFMDRGGYEKENWWTTEGRAWRAEFTHEHCEGGPGRTNPECYPCCWEKGLGFETIDDQSAIEILWYEATANLPVVGVSWYEATAFTNWLSTGLTGKLPEGYQVRLPTEEEWEAACSSDGNGKHRIYPWGDILEPDEVRANFGWSLRGTPEKGFPSPVGERPNGAAPCGAQDMVGSVWEATNTIDPSHKKYLYRGASWWDGEVSCKEVTGLSPEGKEGNLLGFRVVLAPSGSK
jgi:formylglycine-generating enzyme required for sulfatase activity